MVTQMVEVLVRLAGKVLGHFKLYVPETVAEVLKNYPSHHVDRNTRAFDLKAVVMARLEVATGWPDASFGGVCFTKDASYRHTLRLPGGGMVATTLYSPLHEATPIELHICSFGGLTRAKVIVELQNSSVVTRLVPGFEPRRRDWARARMWEKIVHGVPAREAAQSEGLGNNIGHAHAGYPPEGGEEDPRETALRVAALGLAELTERHRVIEEAGRRYLEDYAARNQ